MTHEQHVALIYDAAVEPALWPRLLEGLADHIGAEIGHITIKGANGFADGMLVRADRTIFDEYLKWPLSRNPLAATAWTPVGQILTDPQMVPKSKLRASDYYQDFLRPTGIDSVMAGALWRDKTARAGLGFTRRPGTEDFEAADLAFIQSMAPHLVRAIGIGLRLAGPMPADRAAEAVLDRLPHGVILLDRRGRPCFINREAEAILGSRDGLTLGKSGLQATRASAAAEVARAVALAAGTPGEGSALRIERPSGSRPLSLVITPLRVEMQWLAVAAPAVLVILSDPERGHVPPEQRLIGLYGLTRAEAALTVQLMSGHDVTEIAEQRGTSVLTTRRQLRHVLAKTGTTRQSELVRLLMREAGTVI